MSAPQPMKRCEPCLGMGYKGYHTKRGQWKLRNCSSCRGSGQVPKRLTLKEVKATLATLGISIRSRDGEYRVNFRGGYETSAAYTTDLGDALGTGQAMATRRATQRGATGVNS